MKEDAKKEELLEVLNFPEGKEIVTTYAQIPKLYTLEQLSEKTSLSLHQLRQAIRSGDLIAARIGREYRVTAEDLNGYLRKRRSKV